MNSPFTPVEQFQALNLMDYLSDLFTVAQKETFTRVEILVLLDHIKNDPELFDPAVLIAQQTATAEINSYPS
jgi:uncharacterized protein YllA (UPF0747 family)